MRDVDPTDEEGFSGEPDSGDPPKEYFDQYEKDEEAAGRGKCADCGHKFNKFSSTDFTGKLCDKCFVKTGMSYGTGIGT